ncbi:MAG: ThuA domain-containing protein [Planctomycetaceae bacterium]|jgi:type 1 glutamine amidotransferase|nr:ThuA domain-containing protein [Planctomycetaceae bacterium]
MPKHIFLLLCLLFVPFLVLSAADDAPKTRILIVDDETAGYYRFEGTAALMQKTLNAVKGNETVICGDAEVLATDVIFDYKVLFLHFKNYKRLKRNDAAKANIDKFVRDGGGLFVFHFACGAFEDWTDFDKIIGRVWEPDAQKCPAKQYHDRYGKFTVRIINKEHPITADMTDFETSDELYHCFKPSEVSITVLAEAVSNQDKQPYPIAFILTYGKGRVFHTALGHDAASVSSAGFVQLLKNAVSWLAAD